MLALVLLSLGAEDATPVAQGTELSIDACLAVDPGTVRQVMELEIADADLLPTSVEVRCLDEAQEIRIRRRSDPTQQDVRTYPMDPVPVGETPAERQARSRELALSIAEFVRWPGDKPQPAQGREAPVSAAPLPVPEIAVVPVPTVPSEPRWQLGALYAFERFSPGHSLTGGDLSFASRLGRWALAELRLGGRWGSDRLGSGEQLSTRAVALSVGAGVNLWSKGHGVGGALVGRAQGYFAWVRGDASPEARFSTERLGMLALLVEPRFMLALTHHLFLQASAGVGWVPQGILVRIQGVEAQKLSGIVLAANVAGVITF